MTREYPTRPVVGVGAVVLVPGADRARLGVPGDGGDGIVLVRRRFEPLAGEWTLPGGALEVGETLQAGAAREVAEETGLSVEVGPVIEVLDRITIDPDRRVRYHFVLIDYLCRPMGGRLQAASDAAEAAVVELASLHRSGLTAQAFEVIRRGLALAGHQGDLR